MILSHIVAASENNVIGSNNTLPWNIPEDMKFFREKTKGHIVIMGRKTYESMGKPLPNRLNIVITRQKDYAIDGAQVVASLREAIDIARKETAKWGEEVFIIGGGEIYRESLPMVDLVYLTRIHAEVEGETKYPALSSLNFEVVEERERPGSPAFTFMTYQKKK